MKHYDKPSRWHIWGMGLLGGIVFSAVVGAFLGADQSAAADGLRVTAFLAGVIFGGFLVGYRRRVP